jgi:hypothetical protein
VRLCSAYTPPDIHCMNPAERAIRKWKNHFLAGMLGLPKSFPIANRCCLTMQCNATLNMLRPCCQNPLILAHEALEGLFSFNSTPMAPLGTEVLVRMELNQQSTWGYHASKGWYLLHAANHYHCIQVLMAKTGGERITDMFRFKHHAIPVPEKTATNRIIDATTRLTTSIAGIQDTPPAKWKPSNPFAHSYLARLHRSLYQHEAFFLLLHHPPQWLTKMNLSSFGILNLFSLYCLPEISTLTTSTPTVKLLQSLRMTATMTHLSLVNAPSHLVTISFVHCKTVLSYTIN